MREAVEWIECLPYSTTQMSLSEWGMVGLYGAIVCGLMMMRGSKVHWWWIIGIVISLSLTLTIGITN